MGDFLKTYRALTEKAAPTEALQAVKNFEAWAKLQLEQKGIAKSERQRLAQLFMKELRATEKLGAKQTIKQLLSIRGIAVLRSIGEDMALSDILATASFSSTAVGSQVLSLLCSQEPRNEVEARALIKLLARFTAQSGLESPLGRLAAQNRSLLFESIKDWRRLGAKRKSATKTLERNQTPEHNQRIVRALLKMIARAQKVLKSMLDGREVIKRDLKILESRTMKIIVKEKGLLALEDRLANQETYVNERVEKMKKFNRELSRKKRSLVMEKGLLTLKKPFFSFALPKRQKAEDSRPTLNIKSLKCPKCGESRIVKRGFRKNKRSMKQRYRCNSCRSTFVERAGSERMRHGKGHIVGAVHRAIAQ